MVKTAFAKVARTPEQLLQKLKAQGLSVANDSIALAYLRGVGAYRLKGYWHHLIHPTTKQFPPGTSFDDIAQRCEFDREVRAATIEAVDRLEVAIRSTMANFLALKHSPHWFLDPRIFRPTAKWGMGQLIAKVESEVSRMSGKRFIKHYFDHHDDPYLPPSWAISECVSFGMWSRAFAILRDPTDKKAIAMKFGVTQAEVFESWIHALTVVRNTAAHHSQLLNVQLGVAPSNYRGAGITFRQPKSFYSAATVIHFLLQQTGLPHRWKTDLSTIFANFPRVGIGELGFPTNWQSTAGW